MTKIITVAAFLILGLSGCKSVDQKMQAFDKKVDQTDAKFRHKVGLRPYDEKGQPVVSDSK